MRGTDGLAAAQWASAGLSVFAIVTALLVFIIEQKRNHRSQMVERVRERELILKSRRSEIERHNENVSTCLSVIDEGILALRIVNPVVSDGSLSYFDWNIKSGPPWALRPVLEAAKSILVSVNYQAKLVIALSRGISVMEDASEPRGAVLASGAQHHIGISIDALILVRNNIEGLLKPITF